MFSRIAAAGLALAAATLFVSSEPARAQESGLGPGLIQSPRLTDRGLVIIASPGPKAVPFSGDVVVSAARDAAGWIRFDERASVEARQVVQPGTIGGVPVDEFFAPEKPARLLLRNGDGATTELDVVRLGEYLAITRTNRAPGSPITSVSRSASKDVDALSNAPVALELKNDETRSGLDVVVTVALPTLPDGVTSQTPSLVAIDASGAIRDGAAAPFGQSPTTAFFHLLLPEGSYTLALSESVAFGNPLVSTTTVTFDRVAELPIEVSTESRLFTLTSPPVELPELVDATVTLDGLDQLAPAFGSPLKLGLTFTSPGGSVRVVAPRDVRSPGPLPVSVLLPRGTYDIALEVDRNDDQPNGRSFALFLSLDEHALPADVAVSIPPLVRLSGTVRDPELVLAADPGPLPIGIPSHAIAAQFADGDGRFVAVAIMRGFARSYELYVPRGATVVLSASLTAAVGRPLSRFRAWENAAVRILSSPTDGPIACDADRTVDVTVPDVPSHVTLAGTVADPRGRPVRQSHIEVSGPLGDGADGSTVHVNIVTNDRGEFRLRLPRGRGYRLSIAEP